MEQRNMKINKVANGPIGIVIVVLAVIVICGIVVFSMSKAQSGGQYPPGVKIPSQQQINQYVAAHPLPGPGVSTLTRRRGQ